MQDTRPEYAWASISYCPSRPYNLITVYCCATKEEAEESKAIIDGTGCGNCCRGWHKVEYVRITGRLPRTRLNPYTGVRDTVKYVGRVFSRAD